MNGYAEPTETTRLLDGEVVDIESQTERTVHWRVALDPREIFWFIWNRLRLVLSVTFRCKKVGDYIVDIMLFLFVPLALIYNSFGTNDSIKFFLNFFAIIPLASFISFGTEKLVDVVGSLVGSLLNATLGNVVEIVIFYVAFKAKQPDLILTGILGSILSNIMFVLGLSFFFGNLANLGSSLEQTFEAPAARTQASILLTTSFMILLPPIRKLIPTIANTGAELSGASDQTITYCFSAAVFLLYVLYLFFSLKTHHSLFKNDKSEENDPESFYAVESLILIGLTTYLTGKLADPMVDVVDGVASSLGCSRLFIGLVAIPIVGNAAEHVTAVFAAMRDDVDTAINISLGSGIQIGLFATPICTVMAWWLQESFILNFPILPSMILFVSSVVVLAVTMDGKSNYIEGVILLIMYFGVGVTSWFSESNVVF